MPSQDSLRLRLIDLDIARAETDVTATDLLHRFLPEVRFSASLGIRDLYFGDPSSTNQLVLPSDMYRFTLTIPLGAPLDASAHAKAELQLERLHVERHLELLDQEKKRAAASVKLKTLNDALSLALQQRALLERLHTYYDMEFKAGRVPFNTLIRSRLDVLSSQRTVHELESQIEELAR